MGGALTLYDDQGIASNEEILVQKSLQQSMDNDQFNNAQDGIARVTWLQGTNWDGSQSAPTQPPTISSSSQNMVPIGVGAAVGSVFVLFLGSVIYRRRKITMEADNGTADPGAASKNGTYDKFESDDNSAAG